jgi:predicted Zn finger-like uncharacterized protein
VNPYTRCRDCGFIAPPESMDYAVTADGAIRWDQAVRVTCPCCHASYAITDADVLPAGAATTCHRCSAEVAYPAGAARIRCTGCGLFLLGPDLDDRQREELRITEGLAAVALRETYRAATEEGQ